MVLSKDFALEIIFNIELIGSKNKGFSPKNQLNHAQECQFDRLKTNRSHQGSKWKD
jgi:hypothetical protein